jgi:hypothetical protein
METTYIKACEAYAEGIDEMDNFDFDKLEKDLRAAGSLLPDQLFEDIAIGGVGDTDIDDDSFSIKPVDNWSAVGEFISLYPDTDLIAMLKEDGICTKLAVDRVNMYGQSRNRNKRKALDFSKAVNMVIEKPSVLSPITITGESYVPWEAVEYLREKYDTTKYKMPRSAALSLLRTPEKHDIEDVRKLVFTAFNTNKSFATHSDKLDWLAAKGFRVPKYSVFRLDQSKDIREQMLSIIEAVDTGAPSDGIVLQVNSNSVTPVINGKYQSTQLALKLEKWAGKDSTAEVIGLDLQPKKGTYGCVLLIKPVTMADGATVSRVNAYNLGIVHRNKISKGSIIKFARVSNNMCNLIYDN